MREYHDIILGISPEGPICNCGGYHCRRRRGRAQEEAMKASRERVMLKAFFTQEYLDALSSRDRKIMEALMAADTNEKLHAVIKRLCDDAEKEAIEALNKPESSNPSA